MKLVLLPGMDGTAELFEGFLSGIENTSYQVMKLPQFGPQDYDSLATYVRDRLPDDDFILLAESFSGPLAAKLAAEEIAHLEGIIFVASFLSIPNKTALSIARLLPIKFLSEAPFSSYILRHLMLGVSASDELLLQFRKTVASVPNQVLKDRIRAMQNFVLTGFSSELPVFYLSGSNDHLVSPSKIIEFKHYFSNFTHKQINGPHFLLQANPEDSAVIIREILSGF